MQSEFNDVLVLEFPQPFPGFPPLAGSRALMLDQKREIHSVYREDQVLLGPDFYWEHLAVIAATAPDGPIGILGLGTGTVPRVIHHFWPDRKMFGWELDGVVLHAGRQHMGLKALEDAGVLVSHAGDALADEAAIEGGFAGLVVDLFSAGAAIEPLNHEEAWQDIRQRLRPDGVCIANVGVTRQAADSMLTAFADAESHIKQCGSNMLICTGRNPSGQQAQVHPDLGHITEGWHRVDQATSEE